MIRGAHRSWRSSMTSPSLRSLTFQSGIRSVWEARPAARKCRTPGPGSPFGSAEDLHTISIASTPHLHAAAIELDIGSPGWPVNECLMAASGQTGWICMMKICIEGGLWRSSDSTWCSTPRRSSAHGLLRGPAAASTASRAAHAGGGPSCTAGLCLVQPARVRRAASAWKGGTSHRARDETHWPAHRSSRRRQSHVKGAVHGPLRSRREGIVTRSDARRRHPALVSAGPAGWAHREKTPESPGVQLIFGEVGQMTITIKPPGLRTPGGSQ
jgi:hypothetical protein